jgi:hypothetical protein
LSSVAVLVKSVLPASLVRAAYTLMPLDRPENSADLMAIDVTTRETIMPEQTKVLRQGLLVRLRQPFISDFLRERQELCSLVRDGIYSDSSSRELIGKSLIRKIFALGVSLIPEDYYLVGFDHTIRKMLGATAPAVIQRETFQIMKQSCFLR